MPEKSGMNYQTMREMTKGFKSAQQQLQDTLTAVQKLAKEMEGGALQGQAGQTFQGAITGQLTKQMKKLADKMGELANDVEGARAYYEDGVKDAQSRFK
ncbi:MAG TPA: WXG100 family type VII secretion target [Anaerolineales bacterium]|nr:WXG100 family type VII secretion target [Anaerolineales bacterium]